MVCQFQQRDSSRCHLPPLPGTLCGECQEDYGVTFDLRFCRRCGAGGPVLFAFICKCRLHHACAQYGSVTCTVLPLSSHSFLPLFPPLSLLPSVELILNPLIPPPLSAPPPPSISLILPFPLPPLPSSRLPSLPLPLPPSFLHQVW